MIPRLQPSKWISISMSHKYLFSSRHKNFFEINPIYPDMSEKNFDLYNV